MGYGLQLLNDAGEEPIGLDRAKRHLRVDWDDEDEDITALIKAARKFFEKSTNAALTTQNWELSFDQFPNYQGDPIDYKQLFDKIGIRLPHSPLMPKDGNFQVNAITYVDTAGVVQTLATDQYLVDPDAMPVMITPAWGKIWPVARYQMSAVRVNFTVNPDVDDDMKAGMLMLLGHWHEHREAVLAGGYSEIPLGVQAIIGLNWDGQYGPVM